ncbi:MAG: 50S ribosomal protein L6 [Candidatus Woesearchaeota archaeon]|nr:MAG: 50S ribosomal protein L6 [Candidatus Woesearchaeota archaeon]
MKDLSLEIEIPEKTQAVIEKGIVLIKGPKGELKRKLVDPKIKIEVKDNKIGISSKEAKRNYKRVIGTFRAHINNMIHGVNQGYTYKLKVCSGHFPMSVKLEGKKLVIKNFLGEKIPREAKILDNVKVELQGDLIILEGLDRETVGQTAGNIELATRITNRDRRIFQDGIYIIDKSEGVAK